MISLESIWLSFTQFSPIAAGICSSYVMPAALLALISFVLIRRSWLAETPSRTAKFASEKSLKKERATGEWLPVPFAFPKIEGISGYVSDLKPIPYRPFRWGAYHVTMGIRNMPFQEWIELDNQFTAYHRIKTHRLRTRRPGVLRVQPEVPGVVHSGENAAVELVHELAEFLARRYPNDFKVTRHEPNGPALKYSGWEGKRPIKRITVLPVRETYELPLDTNHGGAEKAMELAALLVQDDLALMIEGTDGRYYFQAGAICLAGFWRMEDKIGMPLEEIHVSGHVPQYEAKLQTSLERFFRRLAVDKPVIRNNYFIQIVKPQSSPDAPPMPTHLSSPPTAGQLTRERAIGRSQNHQENPADTAIRYDRTDRQSSGTAKRNNDTRLDEDVDGDGDMADIDPEELAWSMTTNGAEDEFEHGRPAHLPPRVAPTPETLRLRTERQTLRRLPRSGAVVFTIRTYLVPVVELGKEKGVPGRMASAIRSWPADVGEYKGSQRYREILVDYLDKCHEAQVAMGMVMEDEKVGDYPL